MYGGRRHHLLLVNAADSQRRTRVTSAVTEAASSNGFHINAESDGCRPEVGCQFVPRRVGGRGDVGTWGCGSDGHIGLQSTQGL